MVCNLESARCHLQISEEILIGFSVGHDECGVVVMIIVEMVIRLAGASKRVTM